MPLRDAALTRSCIGLILFHRLAKRLPAVGFTIATTKAVLERDARVVLQQVGLAKLGRVLHECPFALHVAMPGEDEQVCLLYTSDAADE